MGALTIVLCQAILLLQLIPVSRGFFGVSTPLKLDSALRLAYEDHDATFHTPVQTDNSRGPRDSWSRSKTRYCTQLALSGDQGRMCRKDPEMPHTLLFSLKISKDECQRQFVHNRWNCSIGSGHRQALLRKDFKEVSFLYALQAAAMAHSIASACGKGQLQICSCHTETSDGRLLTGADARDAFQERSCGDNISYASKFVKKFMKAGTQTSRKGQLRAKTREHNVNVGLKLLKESMTTQCRCLGSQGVCNKVCWKKLPRFEVIGNKLKSRYNEAVQVNDVSVDNYNKGGSSSSRRVKYRLLLATFSELNTNKMVRDEVPIKSRELAYVDDSPNFCDKTKFSPGTFGRPCYPASGSAPGSCEALCCGRGYDTLPQTIVERCKCTVVWVNGVPEVQCEYCHKTLNVTVCK